MRWRTKGSLTSGKDQHRKNQYIWSINAIPTTWSRKQENEQFLLEFIEMHWWWNSLLPQRQFRQFSFFNKIAPRQIQEIDQSKWSAPPSIAWGPSSAIYNRMTMMIMLLQIWTRTNMMLHDDLPLWLVIGEINRGYKAGQDSLPLKTTSFPLLSIGQNSEFMIHNVCLLQI